MTLRSATLVLAALTSVVSLALLAGGMVDAAAGMMGFIPARLSGMLDLPGALPAISTPFSCTLVHGGFFHLFFNMFMLLVCGVAVERVLGAGALVALYLVSAIVAALAQLSVDPSGVAPVIGASGAVSGVLGAYALSFGRPKRLSASPAVNRAVHIVWLALAWTVLQVAVGYAAGAQGLMLATPAHVGGFLTGLVLQRPLLLWRYRKA
ncbi:rhomboid family intramembrane serine protease [uncultured Sphingomonas sp.]|uniref:rhomboid family intramembrane serine protease n=1 Tax=uncultured Sphingomonas sp. TaxID=158754 RepID=UPI0025EB1FA8|nr:rhomboid family intramembrane serine protease [uncultured Sphingomonas sp.]